MNKQVLNTIVIMTAISSLMLTTTVQARMKCWKNNEGITECGDTVPPEFAQKGHKEIGESGIVREEVERAKTPEELAEEERLAKVEEERLRKEEEKQLKDRILLETFSSVEDIEKARDDRIQSLEASIGITQARKEKIQVDLDKRIERAADRERSGNEPNQELLDDINSLKRQIANIDKFILDKREEQEQIRISHAADIERFKRLKGIE